MSMDSRLTEVEPAIEDGIRDTSHVIAIAATARAIHRWKHPTKPVDMSKCKCGNDAAWAVATTSPDWAMSKAILNLDDRLATRDTRTPEPEENQ
jgi:hypothetical protein